jgi:hypothetical protein
MLLKLLAAVLIATPGFAVGRISWYFEDRSPEWELEEAFPPLRAPSCVAANAHERELFEAAASVLEVTAHDKISPLKIGAEKFLGRGAYRQEGKNSVPVCPPDGIYERISQIVTSNETLIPRLVEYQLRLASKLNPSPHIVKAVGDSAFNPDPQESEYFKHRDIRPYARATLAGFGRHASEFSKVAYESMSDKDSLGTGAAQIAVATGYLDALPRVEAMMNNILSSIPKDKVIPWDTGNRLYELSYAIYFAGPEGKDHVAPIKELMTRTVEKWAPPFGMLDLPPKPMCQVLSRISGPEAIEPYNFCFDDK